MVTKRGCHVRQRPIDATERVRSRQWCRLRPGDHRRTRVLLQRADSFWQYVLAVLKAHVWPALLVYEAFRRFRADRCRTITLIRRGDTQVAPPCALIAPGMMAGMDLATDLAAGDLRRRMLAGPDAALVVEATRGESEPALWGALPAGP